MEEEKDPKISPFIRLNIVMIDGIQISHDMCPESGKKVAGKGADTDQTV